MPRERPILFSAPMVRAILAGRKTQTRRIVKPQPDAEAIDVFCWLAGHLRNAPNGCAEDGLYVRKKTGLHFATHSLYGVPGDRLWVRERWAPLSDAHPEVAKNPGADALASRGFFAADAASEEEANSWVTRWRPSIHMPRSMSRITLEITGVRVERLQDISEADAKAEGVSNLSSFPHWDPTRNIAITPHVHNFMKLWWDINGADSWAANPWVWVVEFKRLEAA